MHAIRTAIIALNEYEITFEILLFRSESRSSFSLLRVTVNGSKKRDEGIANVRARPESHSWTGSLATEMQSLTRLLKRSANRLNSAVRKLAFVQVILHCPGCMQVGNRMRPYIKEKFEGTEIHALISKWDFRDQIVLANLVQF